MDARITKQRLANMLSYDWLKIVGVIALAVLFFCVFFVMIATRPTAGQTFYVYAYDGISPGEDFSRLKDDLKNKNVFAYDILNTGSESFTKSGLYGDSVFTARRAAGEGRVMFVSDTRTADENGKESSVLLNFIYDEGTPQESFGFFADPEVFLSDTQTYLAKFFGDDLSGSLDKAGARASFMERNGRDKRYRSSEKIEAGVLDEEKRLEKLKEDYLCVRNALDSGALGYVTYTTEIKTHTVAFSMKTLNLTPLVFYTVEEEGVSIKKNNDIALCLFDNGDQDGVLKYENVNFIAYLLRAYGTAQ